MKSILVSIALAFAAACAVAVDANNMGYVQLVRPTQTASITGTTTDVAAYKGNATFLVDFGVNTIGSYAATVTLQHSTAGSTWHTVTNLAGTVCAVTKSGAFTNTAPNTVAIDAARLHRYVRATVTQTGYTNAVAAYIVFPFKSQ